MGFKPDGQNARCNNCTLDVYFKYIWSYIKCTMYLGLNLVPGYRGLLFRTEGLGHNLNSGMGMGLLTWN